MGFLDTCPYLPSRVMCSSCQMSPLSIDLCATLVEITTTVTAVVTGWSFCVAVVYTRQVDMANNDWPFHLGPFGDVITTHSFLFTGSTTDLEADPNSGILEAMWFTVYLFTSGFNNCLCAPTRSKQVKHTWAA